MTLHVINGTSWNLPEDLQDYKAVTNFGLLIDDLMADIAITFQMTSTDTITIATGEHTLNPAVMRGVPVGADAYVIANATNKMHGTITAKTPTQLTFDCTSFVGSGEYSAWTIQPAGPQGKTGTPGTNGSNGASALLWAGIHTAAHTLVKTTAIVADTSGGAVPISVPNTTPAEGDEWEIIKIGGNVLTVNRNGVRLNGLEENGTIAAGVQGTVRGRYINASVGYAVSFAPAATA